MRSVRQHITRTAGLLAAGALAVALSGCGGFLDTPDPSLTPPPVRPSDMILPDATPSPRPSETSGTTGEYGGGFGREELAAQATSTIDCGAGGEQTVDPAAGIVRVVGSCASLTVTGSGGSVVTDDVTSLHIAGSDLMVFTAALGELNISGSANAVHWASGEPAVTDTGAGNTASVGG